MTEETNRTVEVKFTFDYWQDEEELKHLLNFRDYYGRLFDIYNMVRTQLKHGDEELSDNIERLLEEIKDLAWVD